MAGAPLQSRVEVDVRPSTQATAALVKTERQLERIQREARAAASEVAQATTAAASVGRPGVTLPTRRPLGALATAANASSFLKLEAGGVKLGRVGTFGTGGFIVGKEALLKSAMPVLALAASARAAAGGFDMLATAIEESKGKGAAEFFKSAGRSVADGTINLFGAKDLARSIAQFDRSVGGTLAYAPDVAEQEAADAEKRLRAAQEAGKFERQVESGLASQYSQLSASWANKPDAYRYNRLLAERLQDTAAEARKRTEAAMLVQAFADGSNY